ncbi:MAG TPA: lysophospholipid acyltransferase family protein [Bdellovibrionales bacterium]|nr:lysophospholipid acyltransferase family protein [Bdellovibrionales bacterium]
MTRILQPFRILAIVTMIFIYLAHMAVVWVAVRERWRKVILANRILRQYCRVGLWILGVRVNPIDSGKMPSTNVLMVGNHLSYLDVLVICSVKPSCFVTSMEIKRTPGLGIICQMAGSLFVDRQNKNNILNEISELREGLENGVNIAIFPEATSTNGERILRFRRPLYTAAVAALKPIVPFCLNYARVGGHPINTVTRDKVMWYGDMDFVPHLWALSGAGGVEVDLHFLPALIPSADSDTTELAARSQAEVEKVFRPVPNNAEGPRDREPSATV